MAKRFTDTDKWKKPFFKLLNQEMKLFWLFLLDDIDHAGIWHVDIELANLRLGTNLSVEDILDSIGDKVVEVDNGQKWFIPSFIEFQNSNGLNPNNNAHKKILETIKKYNLQQHLTRSTEAPPEELKETSVAAQVVVVVEDKVIVEDKVPDNDFDKFVGLFPSTKQKWTHHHLAIWNTLSTRDKQICLSLTPLYVSHQNKTGKDQYIKQVGKFLEEGFYRQLNEYQTRYLGKKFDPKEINDYTPDFNDPDWIFKAGDAYDKGRILKDEE